MDEQDNKSRSDILVEFLEVAFHEILYIRKIYPSTIFALKKKYNVPVHISKHPKVNEYITECLKTTKELLERNGIKKISLLILSEMEVPVEKYVFEIEESNTSYSDRYYVKTEETFREYLLKLIVADVSLNDLPENCTFTIQISTSEQSSVRLNESLQQVHFPWIEADKSQNERLGRILPLKSLTTSLLKLNMYVES